MMTFYSTWEEVRLRKFDGFIVTGTPLGDHPLRGSPLLAGGAADFRVDALQRPFLDVRLLGRDGGALSFPRRAEAAAAARRRSAFIAQKILAPTSPYLSGFADNFATPISRWAQIEAADLEGRAGLDILARNEEKRGQHRGGSRRRGGSTCSTISNMMRRRWRTNIFAT